MPRHKVLSGADVIRIFDFSMEIIPAIIPKDFEHLSAEVEKVRGVVERVQVDVMDGRYTPEASWPYNYTDMVFDEILRHERTLPWSESMQYEVDMMLEKPETHAGNWLLAGATAVIVHLESTRAMGAVIDTVRRTDKKLGIAFRPSTPLKQLSPWISEADFVQCMGNDRIGYHGVSLDGRVFNILRTLRRKYPDLILGVDIGVSLETAPKLVAAGAHRLVSGSAIFGSGDIAGTIKKFQDM